MYGKTNGTRRGGIMNQEFVQAVEDTIHNVMQEMHTAMPGKIISYNSGTASVQPSVKYKTPDGKKLDYPVISNVPVVISCGCGCAVAFPIKPGDECLIIIAEQAIDGWLSGADDDTDLRYDLTNAICIPGLCKESVEAQEEANRKGTIVIRCPPGAAVTLKGDLKVEGNIFYSGDIHRQ